MGPALLVALLGLVLALIQRTHADKILAAFVLAYFATLLPLDAHFDRYVLPLVPALGALAGRVRALASVTLLLVIPLVWSIGDTRELAKTDTRVVAHDWMEANSTPGVFVAADPSTATPEDVRVLRLALPGPGRPPDPERDVARLRRMGVGYVVVTGAVADRAAAAKAHYPRDSRFYEQLEQQGNRRFYQAATGTGGALGSGVRAVEGVPVATRRHGFQVAGAVFVSGAVVLGMEIAASRVLAPFFGNSLFVWGSLIGIVLAGLAIGYWAGGVLADRWPEPRLLAVVMGLGALGVLAIPVLDGPSSRRSSSGIPARG